MLNSLRSVLSTVSENFTDSCFLRIPLSSKTVEEMEIVISKAENIAAIKAFVSSYKNHIISSL